MSAAPKPASGMAAFSPMMSPRPSYGYMQQEVLLEAVTTLIRFPLYCTVFAYLTIPFYKILYDSPWKEMHSWTADHIWLPGWVTEEDMLFTVVLSTSLSTIYVIYNGFFFLLDHYKLLQQYKMPRKPSMEPSQALISSTLKEEAFAHIITGPSLMLLVVGPLIQYSNANYSSSRSSSSSSGGGGGGGVVAVSDVPGFLQLWFTFTICFLCNETMFYWGHRTLHSKAIYKYIHKQHHSYVGTRSYAAEYAHVVEDVFTAYLPFLTGLLITGAHFHVVGCWFWCRLTETYEAHSGYCFKGTWAHRLGLSWAESAAHHDYHHTANKGNFGWAVLDYWCGTMDSWVALGGMEAYTNKTAAPQPKVKVATKTE